MHSISRNIDFPHTTLKLHFGHRDHLGLKEGPESEYIAKNMKTTFSLQKHPEMFRIGFKNIMDGFGAEKNLWSTCKWCWELLIIGRQLIECNY